MGFGAITPTGVDGSSNSTSVTTGSSGENSPEGFKDVLLSGLKIGRTETLVQTKELYEMKEAFKKHGVDVTDALLVEDDVVPRICCIPVK